MSGFSTDTFETRWHRLTLLEQLGNIGSEVERMIAWERKSNPHLAGKALERALALLDLTIQDLRWHGGKRKELTRLREILCDAFVGTNEHNTPHEFFSKYFYAFALAARRNVDKG